MKIAFIALWSPKNLRYWSGTPYYSLGAIRREFPEIEVIDTPVLDFLLYYLGKVTRRANLDILREPITRWLYGAIIKRQIRRIGPDVVLSVGASHKLCDVPKDFATIHVSDALFASITESYEAMSRLSPRSKRFGEDIQTSFLKKVDTLCIASEWAVRSASSHYDLSQCRVRYLPFGANLARDPGYDMAARSANRTLSLLFIGGDWERKGGPLLLSAFAKIRSERPDAELHIVGCTPPEAAGQAGITVHGFLDKSDPQNAATLDGMFRNSAFLVVPSRQEAFGIVFCEAGAYGLPSVGSRTGGIKSILIDGENGMLMAPDASPAAYAQRILVLWNNRDAYLDMCAIARRHYLDRLSWAAWAKEITLEARRFRKDAVNQPQMRAKFR